MYTFVIMNDTSKNFLSDILFKRWFGHVVFWIVLLSFYTIAMKSNYASMSQSFVRNVILLIPQVLATYYIVNFLIPKLLYKKKYVLFGVLFLIGTYVFSILARVLIVYVVEELYREIPFRQESLIEIVTDFKRLYKDFFYKVYLPVFLFICVKLIIERFEQKNKNERLEKEKAKAELNFLKAQIHPHFLFNTLNNLYTLTLQKSDKASDVVLKLSEMFDYMLYKCNDSRVTIAQEIELLQNYIDLEILRYGDRLKLTFNKDVDDMQTQIAPLILVSLIENAFKHGASGSIITPEIKTDIKVKNEVLQFSIYNTKPTNAQKDTTNFKNGIGLANTKSQLELIYPDQHSIDIEEDAISYHVNLKINL